MEIYRTLYLLLLELLRSVTVGIEEEPSRLKSADINHLLEIIVQVADRLNDTASEEEDEDGEPLKVPERTRA